MMPWETSTTVFDDTATDPLAPQPQSHPEMPHSPYTSPQSLTLLDNISLMPVARYIPLDRCSDTGTSQFSPSFALAAPDESPSEYTMVIGCSDGSMTNVISVTSQSSGGFVAFVFDESHLAVLDNISLMGGCVRVMPPLPDDPDGCPSSVVPYMVIADPGARVLVAGPLTLCMPRKWCKGWIPVPSFGGQAQQVLQKYGIQVHFEPGQSHPLPFTPGNTYLKGTVVALPGGGYAVAGCDIAPGGPAPSSDSPVVEAPAVDADGTIIMSPDAAGAPADGPGPGPGSGPGLASAPGAGDGGGT